jgi:hypothetical protein
MYGKCCEVHIQETFFYFNKRTPQASTQIQGYQTSPNGHVTLDCTTFHNVNAVVFFLFYCICVVKLPSVIPNLVWLIQEND